MQVIIKINYIGCEGYPVIGAVYFDVSNFRKPDEFSSYYLCDVEDGIFIDDIHGCVDFNELLSIGEELL